MLFSLHIGCNINKIADELVCFQRRHYRDECRVRLKKHVSMQLEVLDSAVTSYAISAGALFVRTCSLALMTYTNFQMIENMKKLNELEEA